MKKKLNLQKRKWNDHAQSIIEFSFAMMLIALLIYGLVRVFQWSGLIHAEQRIQNTRSFIVCDKKMAAPDNGCDPWPQLKEDFYKPRKMDAVFRWKESK